MRPWAFKVRGGGNATGIKGGPVKAGIQGGVGALYSQDAVFTIATHQDQWIATPPLTDNQYQYSHQMNHPIGKPLRYVSVCSGMEAASVAWHPLGWTPVGFSEIEPFPCAILKHRFPNVPNYGSLTEHHTWPIEPGAIDLLVGGTPCQSFSVAGLRKGLADPRGNLALTFLGLADKLKPKWIVWENVPGVLSSNGGRDFGSFVGALGQLGYGWAMRILDAQHFGVPQRRRRVFVVACLGDWRAAAEVLSLREGLRGYLEAGGKKRKGVASDAGASPTTGCWWDGGQVSQTLDAVLSKGKTMPEKNRFPAVLQPKPVNETIGTLCARDYKGVGNQYVSEGKCIPCKPITYDMKQHHNPQPSENVQLTTKNCAFIRGDTPLVQPVSHWDGSDIHPTLNQSAKGSGGVGASNQELFSQGGAYLVPGAPIPFRKSKRACSTTDNETWVPADVTNTLNNFDLGDTRTTHAVVNSVAPTVTSSGPPYSRTGNERVEAEALAITFKEPIAFDTYNQSVAQTNQALSSSASDVNHYGAVLTPQIPMAVRRLTPVECERLQGFPDNWSRIPWKGKPETECPDGPRYKACGNSMAVPVMRWIGERIANYELNNPSQNHEAK